MERTSKGMLAPDSLSRLNPKSAIAVRFGELSARCKLLPRNVTDREKRFSFSENKYTRERNANAFRPGISGPGPRVALIFEPDTRSTEMNSGCEPESIKGIEEISCEILGDGGQLLDVRDDCCRGETVLLEDSRSLVEGGHDGVCL